MNFFQAQDQARKQSRLLVALFALAVCLLVFVTNICVALFVLYSNPEYGLSGHIDPSLSAHTISDWLINLAKTLGWKKCLWTTLLVFSVIFMAMGFKWLSLRQGGRVVAESVGGTLIQPSTKIQIEKRLLNVVEEIALASGTPVPQVYLLKNELGINAFAAGLSPEDAVIGITQGALLSFNREQLQGVIAHEFSHILNGDMRLNMKLVAVLHGILMIAEGGYFFMRLNSSSRRFGSGFSRNRRSNSLGGLLFILGLSLWLIGLLGQFLGAIIKAAVSRQREFLADASAVQFTRNPEGIAHALSIIGGSSYQSKLEHHGAHELGHLFFSNANSLETSSSLFHPSRWAWFATHPPLADRIKRIQPRWSGRYMKPDVSIEEINRARNPDPNYPSFSDMQSKIAEESPIREQLSGLTANHLSQDTSYQLVEFESTSASVLASDSISQAASINQAELTEQDAFKELSALAHESFEASLFVISLLLSEEPEAKAKQIQEIKKAYPKNNQSRIGKIESLNLKLNKISAKQTLDLIELALPSLKMMSEQQYIREKQLMTAIIQADGKVSIFEWLIFQLVKQYLDRHFGLSRPLKPKYKSLQSLASLYQVVLSRVVHYGFEDKLPEEVDENDKRLAFIRACDVTGIRGLSLMDVAECDGKVFSQAVHRLGLAYPLLKPRLIKGMLAAIHFDEEITDIERYVITAIAVVMDCPLIGLDVGE